MVFHCVWDLGRVAEVGEVFLDERGALASITIETLGVSTNLT